MAENSKESPKQCARCQERPATKGHLWCAECKTESQEKNDAAREAMAEGRGFAKGAQAMKDAILREFRDYNISGVVQIYELTQVISATKSPARLDPVEDV